jgi:hypothetical protein
MKEIVRECPDRAFAEYGFLVHFGQVREGTMVVVNSARGGRASFRVTFFIWLVTFMSLSISVPAEDAQIRVYIDDKPVELEADAIEVQGRVLVPFKGLFQQIGAEVLWTGDRVVATLSRGPVTVELAPGRAEAVVTRGQVPDSTVTTVVVSPPAMIENGCLYVPLRFLGEALLGPGSVQWDPFTRTVRINSGQAAAEQAVVQLSSSGQGPISGAIGPQAAVVSFRDESSDSRSFTDTVPDLLRSALVGHGVSCVESQHIAQVIREMRLQAGGPVEPATAALLGRLVGASHVIYGTLVRAGDRYELIGHVVSVETARILCSPPPAGGSREELPALPARLAQDIADYLQTGTFAQRERRVPLVGYLSVITIPDGAEVYVNDGLIGRSPVTRKEVSIGERRVTVRRKGYADVNEVVVITGERLTTKEYRLEAQPTALTIGTELLWQQVGKGVTAEVTQRYGEYHFWSPVMTVNSIRRVEPKLEVCSPQVELDGRSAEQTGRGLQVPGIALGDHEYTVGGLVKFHVTLYPPLEGASRGVDVVVNLSGRGRLHLESTGQACHLYLDGPLRIKGPSKSVRDTLLLEGEATAAIQVSSVNP